MKSLKESLLDDEDVLMDKSDKSIQIKKWLDKYADYYMIKNYKIRNDLTIDCDSIRIYNCIDFEEFPDYIQFNNVKKFSIEGAQQMKSCKGFPKTCERLYISEIFLTYELNIPSIITDALIITGCPEITSIKTPSKQLNLLRLFNLENLKNLDNIVKNKIKTADLSCLNNIKSLKGLPDNIELLKLSHCRNLYSYDGCPKHIKNIDGEYGIETGFVNGIKKINNIKY